MKFSFHLCGHFHFDGLTILVLIYLPLKIHFSYLIVMLLFQYCPKDLARTEKKGEREKKEKTIQSKLCQGNEFPSTEKSVITNVFLRDPLQ